MVLESYLAKSFALMLKHLHAFIAKGILALTSSWNCYSSSTRVTTAAVLAQCYQSRSVVSACKTSCTGWAYISTLLVIIDIFWRVKENKFVCSCMQPPVNGVEAASLFFVLCMLFHAIACTFIQLNTACMLWVQGSQWLGSDPAQKAPPRLCLCGPTGHAMLNKQLLVWRYMLV